MLRCVKSIRLLLLTAALLLTPGLRSPAITVKVASLAPKGSPWHRALKRIALQWETVSDGRVQLKIYAGGIAGDETDMIRKMRINQIQAAGITGKGLGSIHPDFYIYQLPFMARNDEELDFLFRRLRPRLEKLLEEKGFTFVAFAKSGWLRFFSRVEATTPQEMRRLKLFSMSGSPEIDQAWKQLGFHVVSLDANDVFTGLQNGMVDAFAAAPLIAATLQWFALAPHMDDFSWAPLTAGLIISNRVWRTIPAELHAPLRQSAQRAFDELYEESLKVEGQAMQIMKRNGLVIHHVPEEPLREWRKIVDESFPLLVGGMISPEIFEEATEILKEYRGR